MQMVGRKKAATCYVVACTRKATAVCRCEAFFKTGGFNGPRHISCFLVSVLDCSMCQREMCMVATESSIIMVQWSLAENLHGWTGGTPPPPPPPPPEFPQNILVSNYYFSLPTWLVIVIVLMQ